MRAALLCAVLVAACSSGPSLKRARELLLARCGPVPHAPGIGVSYEIITGEPRAVMRREDYDALARYRMAMDLWTACVEGAR